MILSAPTPQIMLPLQYPTLALRFSFMAVLITPIITCLTMTVLFSLHPHPPSSLYLSLLSLTYRHSISGYPVVSHLNCHTFTPPSPPALIFFHPHHTVSLPQLLSSPLRVSSAVLVTSFSINPVIILNIFFPQ